MALAWKKFPAKERTFKFPSSWKVQLLKKARRPKKTCSSFAIDIFDMLVDIDFWPRFSHFLDLKNPKSMPSATACKGSMDSLAKTFSERSKVSSEDKPWKSMGCSECSPFPDLRIFCPPEILGILISKHL